MSQLSEKLSKIIAQKIEIPSPPLILTQVMREIRDPNSTAAKLAELIASDQGLTTKILKFSNSPFYGLSRKVVNIQQAIVILGFKTTQGLVISASSRSLYKKFGTTEKALWEHSLGAAIAAYTIAKTYRMRYRDEAFVAGLMHDVGKVVMNNVMPEEFQKAVEISKTEGKETFEAEYDVFSFSHTDVGSLLVREWHLSESLEHAIFLHHDLELAESIAGRGVELVYLTNLADKVCHALGIGTPKPQDEIDLCSETSFIELGLDAETFQNLLGEISNAIRQGWVEV